MAERARSESCKRGAKKPTTWHLSLKPFYQSNVQSRLHVDTNGAISIQIVLCSDLQRKRIFASSIRLHYIQLSMQGVVSSSVAIKSQRPAKCNAEECVLSEMPLLLHILSNVSIKAIMLMDPLADSTGETNPKHRNHFTSINSPESF